MTIIREFWLHPFKRSNIPNWPCPKCNKGVLRPLENSFISNEDGFTIIESRKYPDFPEDKRQFRFTVSLRCNNTDCEELVVACGSGYGILDYDEELKDGIYLEMFHPEYFSPVVCIFDIPKSCPEKISDQIKTSFKLFFTDPPASANYVRKTVEKILNDKGIKKYSSTRGKRKAINLHDRILDFGATKSELAKSLLAIKWLGNEGSHADTITKNDVLDAYEILESVLDDLYVGYKRLLEDKVWRINKKKKPLHPTT